MGRLRVTAMMAVMAWVPAAWAQGDSTVAAAGKELGLKWCSECHVVARDQPKAPTDAAPSWYEIANDPSTTEAGLHAFFATPHKQMPNIMLTREETDEIIAYIQSLKSQ
jgi:mono/diheme cytochrome c family protein